MDLSDGIVPINEEFLISIKGSKSAKVYRKN